MQNRKKILAVLSAVTITALMAGCSHQQAGSSGSSEPIVAAKDGKLKGYRDGDLLIFKGIPYAAPPTGDNRWRAPQAVASWQGVKSAQDYGNDCMQKPFPSDAAPLGATPAEDCLYLNVWTPAVKPSAALPVVVWIHGGGFVNGGASPATYDGSEFAKEGVVFVGINYRLGRFGFFAHPALTAAQEGPLGNYGIQDQIAALKWVNDNIAQFGGDTDNITIMGESAGGRSVQLLMQAEAARGQFDKAIIMSGGGRSAMAARSLSEGTSDNPSAEQIGVNMATKHGIEGADAKALSALRALPAEAVTDELNLAQLFMPPPGPPTYVGGVVMDGEMFHESTEKALKQGHVAAVPVMVGTTSADIGFSLVQNKEQLFASFGDHAKQAQQAYDENGDASFENVAYQVGQDRMMQEPARYIAEQMTALGQPAYLYRFGYVADGVDYGKGAQHATDIPFFFDTADIKYPNATEKDIAVADLAFTSFVSFIKSGKPAGENLPAWQPYSASENNIMIFTKDGSAKYGSDPWAARLDAVKSTY